MGDRNDCVVTLCNYDIIENYVRHINLNMEIVCSFLFFYYIFFILPFIGMLFMKKKLCSKDLIYKIIFQGFHFTTKVVSVPKSKIYLLSKVE